MVGKANSNATTLIDKPKQWLECFHGDDNNTINRQVSGLLSDLWSWWTINAARQWTARNEKGDPKGFGLLHGLLDRCFATSHMTAVRRLCDKSPFTGKKGVWSLVSLLDDMALHTHLLTRRSLAETERPGYDPKLASPAEALFEFNQTESHHNTIDLLSGIAADSRSDADQVRPESLAVLQRQLETTCKDVCEKVNKFLAHAAAPESRSALIDDSSSVTPADFLNTATAIREASYFVSEVLLRRAFCPLPWSFLYDPLEYIECPLVSKEDVPKVRRVWEVTRNKLAASFGDEVEFIKRLGLNA